MIFVLAALQGAARQAVRAGEGRSAQELRERPAVHGRPAEEAGRQGRGTATRRHQGED